MKIKTVNCAPSETHSLQHQRNTARSEKSTKSERTSRQDMAEGRKKRKISQRWGLQSAREEAASETEEEERGVGKNVKSVRKHVGRFLSGCRRSSNTQHPRFKSLHAENEKTCCPCRKPRDKKARKCFKKKCLRKWQWKMYSPSGSKGVQLKRIWAYGGGVLVVVLVVCRLVYTEALRPPFALPIAAGGWIMWLGLARVFESAQALL